MTGQTKIVLYYCSLSDKHGYSKIVVLTHIIDKEISVTIEWNEFEVCETNADAIDK